MRSGVATYAAKLARALADRGAGVTVIADERPGEPARSTDGRVRVKRGFQPGATALPRAARAARESGAPVVHLQHEVFLFGGPESTVGLVPALAGLRRRGLGPVVTMHQVVDPSAVDHGFTRLHRVRIPALAARAALGAVQRAVERLAALTLVHERSFAEIVPSAEVVPHGVDAAEPMDQDAARERLDLDAEAFTVLCFGFLAPYKGLEAALEAARRASEVSLVVAGSEHPRLTGREGYASSLRRRYRDAARFAGYVPERDVRAWFSAADAALFPYPRPFASSGAVALALAHRTPLLLSEPLARCISAPDALAVPLDRDRLAARLDRLAADRSLLGAVAEESRRLADARDWSRVADRHLELYEEVSRRARPSRR